ncbi:MAG: hypothetical protein IT306_12210 [Chloroflexi bacterium]|nr:hypothetical protein [Chloroflexota bacterium]
MIDSEAARGLTAQLLQVEERVQRLLTSGWRQASAEADEFCRLAEGLAEVGLPAVAAHVAAVADAPDAATGLRALALAESACRLLRLRLLAQQPPDGWTAVKPPRRRQRTAQDTLIPLARLELEEREVWACSWGVRYQVVLLEPPLAPPERPVVEEQSTGFLGRIKQRLTGQPADAAPGSVWMHWQLRGALSWVGRYPLGASGETALCAMDEAQWIEKPDSSEASQFQQFRMTLAVDNLKRETPVVWWGSGLHVVPADAKELTGSTWIDPSARAAFDAYRFGPAWVLAWSGPAGQFLTPLAMLEPGKLNRPARIVHLLPGLPWDPVSPLP